MEREIKNTDGPPSELPSTDPAQGFSTCEQLSVVPTMMTRPSVVSTMITQPSVVSTMTQPSVVPAMANPSVVPTMAQPSMTPTIAQMPVAPTIAQPSAVPTVAQSSLVSTMAQPSPAPTIAQPSVGPTIAQPLLGPTMAQSSAVPTVARPSAVPTLAQSSSVSTMAQPSLVSTMAQPSAVPTMAQPSSVSTMAQPSLVSTMAQPSSAPTMAQPSLVPTMAQPSAVSTVAQPSLVPTMAQSSVVPTVARPSVVSTIPQTSSITTMARPAVVPTMAQSSLESTMAQLSPVPTVAQPSLVPTMAQSSVVPTVARPSGVSTIPQTSSIPNMSQLSVVSTMTQPSVAPTIAVPSASPLMERKPGPEILQGVILDESSSVEEAHVPHMEVKISDNRMTDGDGAGEGKASANDRPKEILHLPEEEFGVGSSSDPSVIPESQESVVNFSKDDDVPNKEEWDISSKSIVGQMGGTMVGGVISSDIDEEEFKEVTLERGIVQMRIPGNGNTAEPEDADSAVIGVVDYMVRTVDGQLEGLEITSLQERNSMPGQRIDGLAGSSGSVTRTLHGDHVTGALPMDVDPTPSGNGQGDERTGGNGTSAGEIPSGVNTNGGMEADIDPSWRTEDFDLPPSDDEGGVPWSEPPPHVIVELYQRMEREKILDLEWTCLGRRTPDQDLEEMVVEESEKEDKEEEMDQPVEENPTEFDFDIDSVIQSKVTPRRTPGFDPKGSGSSKKRVANMNKVIGDIIRFSKIDEEMEKRGDTGALPAPADLEVTPQRPLGKFHIRRDLHQ